MNILIIGCGKLGSRLANSLYKEGHDVAIVDNEKDSFALLDDAYGGFQVRGNPFDTDVLKSAGIEGCDWVLAVTNEDNVNIMAAQIAKKVFGIQNVIARVLDPMRAHAFETFGIHTICPTNLASEAITAAIDIQNHQKEIFHISGTAFEFVSIHYEKAMKGKTFDDFSHLPHTTLFAIGDANGIVNLYDSSMNRELQETDTMIFAQAVE